MNSTFKAATKNFADNVARKHDSMQRVRVLYCASRRLGYQILRWLVDNSHQFEIAAVCLSESNAPITYNTEIRAFLIEHNISEIRLCEIGDLEYEVGLSVNYDRIIEKDYLDRAAKGFWNLHHSYNMRLRGRNITTYAILTAKDTNIYYHGTSLHRMIPALDAGPIVASKATTIRDEDSAYTLFCRVDDLAYELITEWFPRICFETVYPYEAPYDGVMMYKSKELVSREILDIYDDEKVYDIIRAFDFPGFEPAYQNINQGGVVIKKQYVINSREDFVHTEMKGKYRVYYRIIES